MICDFAEYYGIYDYKSLDPYYCSILACGLRDDSRTVSKGGLSLDVALNAAILDHLKLLVWQNTKDGQKGRNQPESVLESLLNPKKEEKENIRKFKSADDFELYRKKLVERAKDG